MSEAISRIQSGAEDEATRRVTRRREPPAPPPRSWPSSARSWSWPRNPVGRRPRPSATRRASPVPARASTPCSTRAASSRSARWRRLRVIPTRSSATAWSPATAPSTAGRSACSATTRRCSRGSVGEMFGRKVARLMEWVAMVGCPIIGINDSGGARIQDAATSLAWYAELGRRHELLSRPGAAGLDHPRQVRGRRGVLADPDRSGGRGSRSGLHVRHRPRRHQGRHRRGRLASTNSAAPTTRPSTATSTRSSRTRRRRSSTCATT